MDYCEWNSLSQNVYEGRMTKFTKEERNVGKRSPLRRFRTLRESDYE